MGENSAEENCSTNYNDARLKCILSNVVVAVHDSVKNSIICCPDIYRILREYNFL